MQIQDIVVAHYYDVSMILQGRSDPFGVHICIHVAIFKPISEMMSLYNYLL